MNQTAKLFTTGRSQAVRLPLAFRFPGDEVFIRRDPATGDVILSNKPADWDGFFELLKSTKVPLGFMRTRKQSTSRESPFADWVE
jgi:antitoxin VapB